MNMKTNKLFSLPLLFLILLALLNGCASMYVVGSTPVQRAISAADLLIGGNVSDSYIRVYNTEYLKADQSIRDMLSEAEKNDLYYADIADNISDWSQLDNRIGTLQRMYPSGLRGKKDTAIFETRYYSNIKETAYTKATEALYNDALRTSQISVNDSKNISKILANLKRAKKYSHHMDDEINTLAAQTTYDAAEALANTDKPDNLLQASEYYALANSWLPGYKEALEKTQLVKERAAVLYLEEGKRQLRLKDYASLRNAKTSFQKAEKIISGTATRELAEVNNLLTVKLVIVMPDNNYNDEDRIRKVINLEFSSSKSGPETIEINFVRGSLNSLFSLIDIQDADLVLMPSDNYGQVNETYGAVNSETKNVSKNINGIIYSGKDMEQSQLVTVYVQNDFVLYDVRSWRKTVLRYFSNQTSKVSKNFTMRYYSGDAEAKPAGFDPGFLYEAGQYQKFFPELITKNNSMSLLNSSGSLSTEGKELCNVIKNLQYIERRK